eukprot:m51a1_g8246 putative glucosamine 6-phosphate n-acetyltransferase (159) ;mRNA; f:128425-129111
MLRDPTEISGVRFRPLEQGDYARGFCDVLEELTETDCSESLFAERFADMRKAGLYYVVVGEDLQTGLIECAATLVVEAKFIHKAGYVGHIEDVVVAGRARGRRLGDALVGQLLHLGLGPCGCYKVILDCHHDVAPFYCKCGMKENGVQMALYKRDLPA